MQCNFIVDGKGVGAILRMDKNVAIIGKFMLNGFYVTCFRTFLQTPYLLLIGGQYRWAGRN